MSIRFELEPVSPFRLDLTVWTLRRRANNAVDRWDGETYRRSLVFDGSLAEVEVRQTAPPDHPRIEVSVTSDGPTSHVRAEVTATLRRMLGLEIDLVDFYRRGEELPELRPSKTVALVELATRISDEDLDLEGLVQLGDEAAVTALVGLRGIGRWSAEYALLRGLGRVGVFPGDDVGARNNLQRLLGIDTGMNYDAVARAVTPWSPFSGLVYFHLLLDRLDESGLLSDV